MKLASTKLVTQDVRALAQFYAAVTRIVPVGIEDYVELETITGTLAISSKRGIDLFYAGAAEPAANRSVIIDFEVDNVDHERARLSPLVGEFVMEPTDQPWGSRAMLFRDPDGNLVSFSAQSTVETLNSSEKNAVREKGRTSVAEEPSTSRAQRDRLLSKTTKKTMKKQIAVHWTTTAAISFFMLFSAYYTGSHRVEFAQLGFPNYFRIELTVAKIIGALMLLIPAVPARVREWIYASFSIVLVSAFIAKLNNGYPVSGLVEPLFVLTTMVVSLVYLDKLNQAVGKKQGEEAVAP